MVISENHNTVYLMKDVADVIVFISVYFCEWNKCFKMSI